MNNFENLKSRIKAREFSGQSEARYEITKSFVKGQISTEEHMELRLLLIEMYKD